VGARLHGCIAGLINKIPSVLFARDLRIREIAEFFEIPVFSYEELEHKRSIEQLFNEVDFDGFNSTYRIRYDNFLDFLDLNGLKHNIGDCQKRCCPGSA